MRNIREVIEGGGPREGENVARMALRATSRISDPVRQAALYDRLLVILRSFELERIAGGSEPLASTDAALMTLDEIEAASLPN